MKADLCIQITRKVDTMIWYLGQWILMGPLPKLVMPFYNRVHSASRVLHTHVSVQVTQEPEGIFHNS